MRNVWYYLSLCIIALFPSAALSQTFFVPPGTEPATGVDRGSTSQISRTDRPTGFATFDTYGAEAIGRPVASLSFALPGILLENDQLDLVAVLGGPSNQGRRELLAMGIGYRFDLGNGLTAFANGDHSDFILGDEEGLALDVGGTVTNASLGLTREWRRSPMHRTRATLSLGLRQEDTTLLGAPVTDENLRFLRLAVLDEKGMPFSSARRMSLALTKGLTWLGATAANNPLASAPGADPGFVRVSGAFEASLPLSDVFVINAGVVVQWSDDSLPISQRCGYGTNTYARGFDRSFVNGDSCLGGRVELGYDFERPDPRSPRLSATQAFIGLDAGRVRDNANAFVPAADDGWSSLSTGIRVLKGNFLGEVQATRILDEPAGAFNQSGSRLWLRGAIRF